MKLSPDFSRAPRRPLAAGRRPRWPRTGGSGARTTPRPLPLTIPPMCRQLVSAHIAARQHDQEPADADKDDLRDHSGQEQADTDHEPDRRLDDPALVVDLGVLRAHRLGKLRIVGIERLLDLLELTLLVLRERHCASHEPLAWGRVR